MLELTDMFPDEETATRWIEKVIWSDGRVCPHCGSKHTREAARSSVLPYYCNDCRKQFSVKVGTAMHNSRISLRKWVFAIYFEMTNLKGVSSMKLHRDIGVSQKTAWFMLHRIREAWSEDLTDVFASEIEIDETYVGGKRKNMHAAKRRELTGRGTVGKTIVVGAKDRETNQITAKVVPSTDAATLQGFAKDVTSPEATIYTDEARAYIGLGQERTHKMVNHSVGKYVEDMASTNGLESFWSMLKRGYHGVYHHISAKHLGRYVAEYAGRHNFRQKNTIDQMEEVIARMVGKQLMYKDLITEKVEV
ncbi:MAG: IS1595 family transposase [Aestuariivita sp.]|nr:IS1595 family transposase [Aestuariivita sp.]